jgi:hypothetical protein
MGSNNNWQLRVLRLTSLLIAVNGDGVVHGCNALLLTRFQVFHFTGSR